MGDGIGTYAVVIPWFAWITIVALRMLRVAAASTTRPVDPS